MRTLLLLGWALLVMGLSGSGAGAAAPQQLSFQARVTDASGNSIADGAHSITFRLYDQGDTLVWTETQSVTTSAGLFSTVLGAVTPFSPSLRWDGADSLGLSIAGGAELVPRYALSASPYSLDNRWQLVGARISPVGTDSISLATSDADPTGLYVRRVGSGIHFGENVNASSVGGDAFGMAVGAQTSGASGRGYGVYALAQSGTADTAVGVYGRASNTGGGLAFAAQFDGDVLANGYLDVRDSLLVNGVRLTDNWRQVNTRLLPHNTDSTYVATADTTIRGLFVHRSGNGTRIGGDFYANSSDDFATAIQVSAVANDFNGVAVGVDARSAGYTAPSTAGRFSADATDNSALGLQATVTTHNSGDATGATISASAPDANGAAMGVHVDGSTYGNGAATGLEVAAGTFGSTGASIGQTIQSYSYTPDSAIGLRVTVANNGGGGALAAEFNGDVTINGQLRLNPARHDTAGTVELFNVGRTPQGITSLPVLISDGINSCQFTTPADSGTVEVDVDLTSITFSNFNDFVILALYNETTLSYVGQGRDYHPQVASMRVPMHARWAFTKSDAVSTTYRVFIRLPVIPAGTATINLNTGGASANAMTWTFHPR